MNFSTLIQNFHYLRYSVGISMMVNGFPIIFFVRDTLGIGPASSVFTAVFFVAALLIMFPTRLSLRAYKPNMLLFQLGMLFFGILVYYFFFFNGVGKGVTDIANFGLTFLFFILLLYVPNEVQKTLVLVLFAMSFLNNLTLIYSLLTNPSWTLGMRAAVTFANENAQEGGNPHLAARNALICLLTAYVLIGEYKQVLVKVFFILSVLFAFAVIILTQSKSCLLGTGIIMATHFFLRFNFSTLGSSIRQLFTLRVLTIVLVVIGLINYLIKRFHGVYSIILGYWDVLGTRFENVIFTTFGLETGEDVEVDASAMGRIDSFEFFERALDDPKVLIIGNGYKTEFMDVPPIEMLGNHGIIGAAVFMALNFYFFYFSIREIKFQRSAFAVFLASFFMYFPALLISSGRPYDIAYWFPYVLFIRFLGLPYLGPIEKEKKKQATGLATV